MARHALLAFALTALLGAACMPGARADDPQPPGFEIFLTSNGANYAMATAVPVVLQRIVTTPIPDEAISVGTSVGSFNVYLSNTGVVSITVGGQSVNLAGSITLTSVAIHVGANWRYRKNSFPNIKDSGYVDLYGTLNVNIVVAPGITADGHASIGVTSCVAQFIDFKPDFHAGGTSWIYDLFKGPLSDAISSKLQSLICDAASSTLPEEANKVLAKVPVVEEFGSVASVDFRMLAAPQLLGPYARSTHKGEFFSTSKPVEAPFPIVPLPGDIPASDRMLYAYIGEYVLQSAGFAFYTSGELEHVVHATEIPKSSPVQLNTSSFIEAIPELYKSCSDCEMALRIAASSYPSISVTADGIAVVVVSSVDVMTKASATAPFTTAFTLNATFEANGTASLFVDANGGNRVGGHLTLLTLDLEMLQSEIGPVDLGSIKGLVSLALSQVALPAANKRLAVGFALPSIPNIQLANVLVSYYDHYFAIETDMHYSAPAIFTLVNKDRLVPVEAEAEALREVSEQ